MKKFVTFSSLSIVIIIFITALSLIFGNPFFLPSRTQADTTATTTSTQTIADSAAVLEINTSSPSIPTQLAIPSINVKAPVKAMGLEDGRMAVPHNFTDIGWYIFGSNPGQTGNVVMGAHVDNGSTIPGVFKNLKNIKVGDRILITDANNNIYTYKVTSLKIYNYQTTDTGAIFGETSKSELHLITCYGTWLKSKNTYNERLVVTAEFVSIEK